MILTAHQPVYLPWLGLFHKIALADAYCYFDDVQFLIKDFNSRNKIKTQNGAIWLTIPVLSKNYRQKTIKEIKIDNSQNWRHKHWKSIHLAYKKAPFFDRYADFFEKTYSKEWHFLTEINEYMLEWFLNELGIGVKIFKASAYGFQGKKTDLVVDMCKKLDAQNYIFGALGKDYCQAEKFKNENISIYFQDYKHPIYPQLHGNFIPYMSIIDLLFNCGGKSFSILMEGNIKKQELFKNTK